MRLHRSLIVATLAFLLTACGTTTTTPNQQPSPVAIASVPALACPDAPGPLAGGLVFGAAGSLVAMDINGGNPTRLTTLPQVATAHDPAWSPDGQTLAYTLTQPGSDPVLPWLPVSTLCGLDRTTGKGRSLAQGQDMRDSLDEPAWTPDGKALLATLRRAQLDGQKNYTGDATSVVRYDLAAARMDELVKDATSPTFGPDGRLAYLKLDTTTFASTLMIAQADGSAAKPISLAEPPFGTMAGPRWSPDGKQIAFVASGGPGGATKLPSLAQSIFDTLLGVKVAHAHGLPSDIWLVDTETQQLRQLTKKGLDDPRVAWNPAGQSLAYIGGGGGTVKLFDLVNGQERQLTDQGDYGGIAWAPR